MLLICGNNENEEALFNDWLKSDAAKSRGKEPLIVDYRKLFIGNWSIAAVFRLISIISWVPFLSYLLARFVMLRMLFEDGNVNILL